MLWPMEAVAQRMCGDRERMEGFLTETYKETEVWRGTTQQGNLLTLWLNAERETWSLVGRSARDDRLCMMDHGSGFEFPPVADTTESASIH